MAPNPSQSSVACSDGRFGSIDDGSAAGSPGTAVKVDSKKSLDAYRTTHLEFRVLDVPSLHYLTVDGHPDPNT